MSRKRRLRVVRRWWLGGGGWAAVWLAAGAAAGAECTRPLDAETLQELELRTHSPSVRPGGGADFVLGRQVCCVFWESVPACVEWSIEPPGSGSIQFDDPPRRTRTGTLVVAPAAAHGTVITLRADVEEGRRVLEARLHVYTREANPLVGRWRELAQESCQGFVRGDPDANAKIDITDAIHVFGALFLGGPPPPCREAADANADRAIDIADGVYILSFLFLAGEPPPAPFPACASWPGRGGFGCGSYPACARGELKPTEAIGELLFEADGTFSVTWIPFEVYRDYWGTYSFDLASGAIDLSVEGGNYVPPDLWSAAPTFSIEGDRLLLRDLWLGADPRAELAPPACGHRFQYR